MFWVNRFSLDIGTLWDGMKTKLLVVIVHMDILFTFVPIEDKREDRKFKTQVVSAYPIEKPDTADSTQHE